jgi:hypothetical protein
MTIGLIVVIVIISAIIIVINRVGQDDADQSGEVRQSLSRAVRQYQQLPAYLAFRDRLETLEHDQEGRVGIRSGLVSPFDALAWIVVVVGAIVVRPTSCRHPTAPFLVDVLVVTTAAAAAAAAAASIAIDGHSSADFSYFPPCRHRHNIISFCRHLSLAHFAPSCAVLRRLAPSCAVLRRLAPSCAVLRRLAPSAR